MRVLVQEGSRLALRADGEQLFEVRGLLRLRRARCRVSDRV